MIFPKNDWAYTTPETVGMDSKKLKQALDYYIWNSLEAGEENAINEMMIIKDGYVIWEGDRTNDLHEIWSCTKSFTSTVLGLLIEEHKCSLDTKACEYLPQLTEAYGDVTLRHFTTMTSGYNAVGCTYDEDGSLDPFVPAAPFFAPGKMYQYWDDAMNVFGKVLSKIAGESMLDVFKRRIADAIGMKDIEWGSFGIENGIEINGGSANHAKGVFITAREFAKFGHLYLNKGNWDGKQLLSEKWVEAATSAQVSNLMPSVVYSQRPHLAGSGIYGYNWWVNGKSKDGKLALPDVPEAMYYASGIKNNKCFVIPEWNMVIVRMGTYGHRIENIVLNNFLKKIGEAIVQ